MNIFRANATSKFFFVATLLISAGILMLALPCVESIGICNGLLGDNLPSAAETIELYRNNSVTHMRLYSADQETLDALKGSNIELILDVSNDKLEKFANDASAADQWVQDNVVRFVPSVKFKYISVGNEVNSTSNMAQFVAPAMRNIHQAILSAGLQIKVSTSMDTGFLGVSHPPSQGAFKDEAKAYMGQIIKILKENGAPLLVNVYPYFSYVDNTKDIKLSYALFESSECEVNDRNLCYKNLFDATLDSIYSALEKEGGPNVNVVVTETGWPSEGGVGATAGNAATYYGNLIQHVKGEGSPKKPGPIETYLFAMYDENTKTGPETERHFGLFNPTNKQSKYQISYSGSVWSSGVESLYWGSLLGIILLGITWVCF